jgi:hypothetical protein
MIDPLAFSEILAELLKRPLAENKYRSVAGVGRSQAFGVVSKRCMLPDYSRQCWLRPYLYKLLLEFGEKHVPFKYTSITVNQSYKCEAHRDRGNVGESLLVAFGDYQGGELEIHEGELKGIHNIRHTPIITDFSKVLHSVKEFQGERFSLVYYTAKKSSHLPEGSVIIKDGKYIFMRGLEECKGLPHPLKNRIKKNSYTFVREEKEVEIDFNS